MASQSDKSNIQQLDEPLWRSILDVPFGVPQLDALGLIKVAQIPALNYISKSGDTGVMLFTFANNQGIDVDLSVGSDTLNIGTANADVINIGWAGATVNIQGTTFYQNVTELQVKDKLFTVNKGGSAGSGNSAGFEVEENAIITGWFSTNGTRDGWDFKAPASQQFTLLLSSLTAARVGTVQDSSGTFAWLADIPTSLPPIGLAGGELSGSYPNPTLLNSAVIGKVLTGYVSGAGTVTAADSILSAIQKLNGNTAAIPSYTFTSGLTNTANTITNDLITGKTGGQAVVGGTGVTDALTYKSTTGVGTPTADAHVFTGGTNGSTILFTLKNNKNAFFAGDTEIATNLTVPLIVGGVSIGSNITYKSTTSAGTTTAAAHIFTGGANGATEILRMRNDGVVIVGATTPITDEIVSIQKNQNALTRAIISNTTSGTASRCVFQAFTNGSVSVLFGAYSSGYTSSGMQVANTGALLSTQTGGLNVGTTSASQFSIWTNNTLRAIFSSGGDFNIGGSTYLGSTVTAPTEILDVLGNIKIVGQSYSPFVTLTDAVNIATNCNLGQNFIVTLGGNRTLDNPTNMKDGATYTWYINQDGTGSRTLAYGSKFDWAGSTPTLTTTLNKYDVISGIYNAAKDKLAMVIAKNYG